MITVIVKIKKPDDLNLQQYHAVAQTIVGNFQGVPGLIRKTFLFSDSQGCAGGAYTWETKEAADTFYAGVWLDNIRKMFGEEPELTYFNTPVIVDNAAGTVVVADPDSLDGGAQ